MAELDSSSGAYSHNKRFWFLSILKQRTVSYREVNHLLHMSSYHNLNKGHNPKGTSRTIQLPCASQFPYLEQERNIQSEKTKCDWLYSNMKSVIYFSWFLGIYNLILGQLINWNWGWTYHLFITMQQIQVCEYVLSFIITVFRYLSPSVWHEAGGWEFFHISIYKRVPVRTWWRHKTSVDVIGKHVDKLICFTCFPYVAW